MASSDAPEALLRLALTPGIGPARMAALLRRFGTAERVLAASPRELRSLPGFGEAYVARLLETRMPVGAARVREARAAMERAGATVILPDDPVFPEAFRHLPDPPFLLFAAGDASLLAAASVGVVGTRHPTDYGRRSAAALSGELARNGWAIVSGMAKGIDAAAHAAALEAGGGTVGVLGHGIDRVYPPENRRLFDTVRTRGLLLTEMAPGEDPNAGNFPRRNRLIAALSAGVLVVEMGERSGARHTVDYALELGREVFSVPGPIGAPESAGTNQLLKEGAHLVTSSRDIVEVLRGVGHAASPPPRAAPPAPSPAARPDLAPAESAVWTALAADPRHVDEVAAAAGLAPPTVLTALLRLELLELAESLPGKLYRRR